MARHIWCPACRCDVKYLLGVTIKKEYARVLADKKQIREAFKRLERVVNGMEKHARAKGDEKKSVQEIYRMWSTELLNDVRKHFPEIVIAGSAVE